MPLKFVTNTVTTENGTTTVNPNGTTPTTNFVPTATTLSEQGNPGTFVPESVTTYSETNPSTGFSLSFTDGATYDLDQILFNIRRDNPDSPLIMKVSSADAELEALVMTATGQILQEYFNNEFMEANPSVIPSISLIPNFASLLETKLELVDREALESEIQEGSLSINNTQPKIGVKKEDIMKYLLSDKPAQRSAPLINLNRPIAIWTEGQGDLNQRSDFPEFDTLNNVIDDLQAEIDSNDGGDFVIEDLDGGDFLEEYDDNEENGGGF
jgi:hypothetical protein